MAIKVTDETNLNLRLFDRGRRSSFLLFGGSMLNEPAC